LRPPPRSFPDNEVFFLFQKKTNAYLKPSSYFLKAQNNSTCFFPSDPVPAADEQIPDHSIFYYNELSDKFSYSFNKHHSHTQKKEKKGKQIRKDFSRWISM